METSEQKPLSLPDYSIPLNRLLIKPLRAHDAIAALDRALDEFFKSPAYHVKHKDTAGERTYYLNILKEFPLQFSAAIGDILQNLRSALDHLAHHLVALGTHSDGPHKHVFIFQFSSLRASTRLITPKS